MSSKILLLRSSDGNNDKYHRCFTTHAPGLQISSIPILDFEFCRRAELTDIVQTWTRYSGVIFTSPRASEAFCGCLTTIKQPLKDEILSKIRQNWFIFVVGKGTSRLLNELNLEYLGENCGNAEELAHFISKFYRENICTLSNQGDSLISAKPLIFLCGNLAREVVPDCLQRDNVPFETLCVYKTKPSADFGTRIEEYVERNSSPNIIVFFSPSGVEYSLDLLSKVFLNLSNIKTVAIGKTTATALRDIGCQCDGIAQKPTPESLLDTVSGLI